MPDIAALAQASLAATSLNNLIIVTPNVDIGIQPQNKSAAAEEKQSVSLSKRAGISHIAVAPPALRRNS